MEKQVNNIVDNVDVSSCKPNCSLKYCLGFKCANWNILQASQHISIINNKLSQQAKQIKDIAESIYCDCHGECEDYIEEGLSQIIELLDTLQQSIGMK